MDQIEKTRLIDVQMAAEQEGTKATVQTWHKQVGDAVALDELLVEIETDKVVVEVAAPAAGVLREIILQTGAEAGPGDVLARIEAGAAPGAPAPVVVAAEAPKQSEWRQESAPVEFDRELRLSPSVRRLLRENDLDPAGIAGTGRHGRISREDVLASLAKPKAAPVAAVPKIAAGTSQKIPHTTMRRRIAEHMSHSLQVAPHVTAVFECDFTAISAHRKANKESFAKNGANLTFTTYFVAAIVEAMREVPTVNSRWHDDAIEVFGDVNVGIGTDLGDKGLIVPVLHKSNELSLLGIATRLTELVDKARRGKLAPADVQNGTFSISNHGVSGSLVAAPIIINQPQSAILGVGKLEKRVVVREVDGVDSIQIRPMAYVSLSIDHRVLDGNQTNAWLSKFVSVLEGWQ
ncbi:dihydrolipoamide acetyltransferase family protein [Roseiterribacter gracilis]|uniref:Dihydrolipoamide acetyltransferase component of pyruvate dehydrogenase complex n=1 Tax=Roseiterribacter gracilis TaxID=2812848 RepID=A0A8S8X8U5_9PROT|nr:dihydrolipoamide acetyltransferase component of pyruvate dehydrogenase complex [Rhodospirillales bacterium TMPK1]